MICWRILFVLTGIWLAGCASAPPGSEPAMIPVPSEVAAGKGAVYSLDLKNKVMAVDAERFPRTKKRQVQFVGAFSVEKGKVRLSRWVILHDGRNPQVYYARSISNQAGGVTHTVREGGPPGK